MKLPEFRKQIETYSIEELRYLTAELYKAIPKKIKEERRLTPWFCLFRSISKKMEQARPLPPLK